MLIEYDGSAYHGWQIQEQGDTLQGILEDRIFRVTGEQSRITGASRTDAGVHALGQVAAFKTDSLLEPATIKKAMNAVLPQDIRILDASEADASFHPREDAKQKSYFYLITNQYTSSVFFSRYSWLVRQHIDVGAMTDASRMLLGEHDFSSFMGAGSDVRSAVRKIFSLHIERLETMNFMTAVMRGNFIKISIEANGFLRHMVRNIVGTLVEVGRGRIRIERIREILISGDRRRAGQTVPAHGLFLERIDY